MFKKIINDFYLLLKQWLKKYGHNNQLRTPEMVWVNALMVLNFQRTTHLDNGLVVTFNLHLTDVVMPH